MVVSGTKIGPAARHIVRIAPWPIALSIILFLCWFGLNSLSLTINQGPSFAHVRAAFQSGALRTDGPWFKGDTGIGSHQWNDCLILFQAIDQGAPANQLAVSPLTPPDNGDRGPCPTLRAFSLGEPLAAEPPFYHRYIHGQTALARFLLPILPVERIRGLYSLIETLLVSAGILAGLWSVARPARKAAGLFWLLVFAAFSRWYGFESFGQSLGHGPSDIVLLALLLFLAIASARGGLGRMQLIIAASLFGGCTAIFELLTGGIPLGLAVMIGATPFALSRDCTDRVGAALEAAAAFCIAVATCLALKLAFVARVFGAGALQDIFGALLFRLGYGHAEAGEPKAGLHDFAFGVSSGLESLAAGERPLTFLVLIGSLGAGLWGLRQIRRSGARAEIERASLLAASNLTLPLWMLVFWQHTAQHARFMDRIFVWTIASGSALFLLAALGLTEPAGRTETPAMPPYDDEELELA